MLINISNIDYFDIQLCAGMHTGCIIVGANRVFCRRWNVPHITARLQLLAKNHESWDRHTSRRKESERKRKEVGAGMGKRKKRRKRERNSIISLPD